MSDALHLRVSSCARGGVFALGLEGLIPAVSGSQVPSLGAWARQQQQRRPWPGLAALAFLAAAGVWGCHSREHQGDNP